MNGEKLDRRAKIFFLHFVREAEGLDVFDPWQNRPTRVRLQEARYVADPIGCDQETLSDYQREAKELADALAGQALAIQVGTGGSSLWVRILIRDAMNNRALLGTNGHGR